MMMQLDSPYMISYKYLIVMVWPNSVILLYARLQNLTEFAFDLSMSSKVKCDGVSGFPIYDFLLVFNSNIWPNSAPLRDMSLQSLGDLDFDPKSRRNVMFAIELSIYGFL